MALFRIDQATPGAGTAGLSRHDLVPGEVITLTATSPVGAGITYSWEILDKVNTTAVLSATTGASVTIGVAGLISQPCAFLIRLTVNNNGTITTEDRIASVRSLKGLRVPLFPETAPASNTLSSNDPSLSTDNAQYASRAGISAGQNWRGWAEWTYEVVMALESLSASPLGTYTVPGTVAVGDTVYVTGASTADKASNAAFATAGGAVGIVVQKPTGTTAVVALAGEVSTLSGLTAGLTYFLGTAGAVTATPPTSAGQVVRRIGVAKSATTLSLDIGEPWVIQAGSPPMKYDAVTKVLAQFAPGDTLNLTVRGDGTTVAIRALSSFAAASGAELIGVDITGLSNSAPGSTDLQTVLEALDAAIGGGGGGSLQDAYDLGTDITQSVAGGILIAQGSGSPANNYVLRLNANVGAGYPMNVLMIQHEPTPVGDSGVGATIRMGANATGEGISVQHLGSGTGVLVATTGTGNGLTVDTSSGTGDGVFVFVATGQNPIQSQINGVNALTIDGAGSRVDIGAAAGVLEITGYGNVVLGSGTGATLKAYRAYTTDAGTSLGTTNGRMTVVSRAGVNTAASTVAELAVGAGSAGETLLTKGGRLYANTTIREILIENGVTLAAGDVVRPQSASHVGKASADVNGIPALGIVLVGGVGDGTTVYALVAMQGYVSGLTGLTTGATVYLGTTAGQYTTTMPTAAGARVVALGQAISTTEMILNVDIPRTPSLIALPVNAEQTGTAELSVGMVYLSSGAVVAADSRAMLGATSGVSDTADLRLRRFTGGTQVAIFSATGTPANTAITASYTVAASDWYELTLAAGGVAQVARCQGVQLRVYGETN